jgi:AraC-like DNA-binding protein
VRARTSVLPRSSGDDLEQGHVSAGPCGQQDAVIEWSHRDEAKIAISAMGEHAFTLVSTGALTHFGQWLDWPDWMRDGTTLADAGPLPPQITLSDDLIITANVLDRCDAIDLIARSFSGPRLAFGSTSTLIYTNAPTLGDALAFLCRSCRLGSPFLDLRLEQHGAQLVLSIETLTPLPKLMNFIAVLGLTMIGRVIETYAAGRSEEMAMHLTHSDPRLKFALQSTFACRIECESPFNRLIMPSTWANLVNPHSDPSLWLLAQERLGASERAAGEIMTIARIRALVIAALIEQARVPRLKQIAVDMKMSARTIVRLLATHGTSFHELVEQERRSLVAQLISDPSKSLAQVARLTGFTDVSSFGRSFRLWHGDTPGRFRRRQALSIAM